jgi:hypothetical protein
MPEPCIAAALPRWNLRVAHRQALAVRLVEHRIGPRNRWRPIRTPLEWIVDDDAAWQMQRAVGRGDACAAPPALLTRGDQIRMPRDGPVDGMRVGIQQQLVRIEAHALARPIGPVGTESVPRACASAGQQPAPPMRADPLQRHLRHPFTSSRLPLHLHGRRIRRRDRHDRARCREHGTGRGGWSFERVAHARISTSAWSGRRHPPTAGCRPSDSRRA